MSSASPGSSAGQAPEGAGAGLRRLRHRPRRGAGARRCARQVYGSPFMRGFGAFAEFVRVPAECLAPKPASLSHERAPPCRRRQRPAGPARPRPRRPRLVVSRPRCVGRRRHVRPAGRGARRRGHGRCSTRNVDLVRLLGATHVVDYTSRGRHAGGRAAKTSSSRSPVSTPPPPCAACSRPRGVLVQVSGDSGGRWVGASAGCGPGRQRRSSARRSPASPCGRTRPTCGPDRDGRRRAPPHAGRRAHLPLHRAARGPGVPGGGPRLRQGRDRLSPERRGPSVSPARPRRRGGQRARRRAVRLDNRPSSSALVATTWGTTSGGEGTMPGRRRPVGHGDHAAGVGHDGDGAVLETRVTGPVPRGRRALRHPVPRSAPSCPDLPPAAR